jgi:hypothetical protein
MDDKSNPVINMIDRPINGEEAIKKWVINLFRPFLLGLFNEQWIDYSQLILEEAKKQLGAFPANAD